MGKKCFRATLLFFLISFSFISFANTSTPDSLLLKFHDTDNDSVRIQALREIVNFWKPRNSDSTIYYSKLLINHSLKRNDFKMLFKGYYNTVNYYGALGSYDSALHYAFIGLDVFKKDSNLYRYAIFLTLIGEQYRAMSQFENSLLYLEKGWRLVRKSDRYSLQAGLANRLAAVNFEMKKPESAILWADSSLMYANKGNINNYVVSNLNIKGAINRDKGNYTQAIDNFKDALLTVRKLNDDYDVSTILNNIASTYINLEDYNSAIKYAEESYKYSVAGDRKALSVVSTEILANAYAEIGEFDKAYKYLRIYEEIRHDLFYAERDKQISELNTKYETHEKEQQIEIQNANIAKKDFKIRQNNIVIFFFLFLLLLLVGFVVYRYLAHKRLKAVNDQLAKKNTQISNQKVEIETYAKKVNEAYEKLQELDEYKQAMTSMLVHDLKNPLNLLVNIDLFESEDEKREIVNSTSKQMLNLILNLLDINKAENNNIELDKTDVNLFDIIQLAFQDVEFLCLEKEIRIINKSKKNYDLSADVGILKRVFINLFTNAIKFSPSNSVIIIDTNISTDKKLLISVKDNGPGIAEEHHEAIFEKFNQVKKVKSGNIGSTGLGLAFCKIAVESHNWSIGLESKPGNGAEFWILVSDYCENEDSRTASRDLDDSKDEQTEILISDSDMLIIKPYLEELLRLNVYAISAIKNILSVIKEMNIENITPWLDNVNLAAKTLDKEKFEFLIKSLLK